MEALRRSAPVPVSIEPLQENMDGYFSPEKQQIVIRAGMSEVQTVSAAVHEIAHSKLHNYEKEREAAAAGTKQEAPKKKDRQTEEVEAESISYTVCQYFGIQTGENSFGYIASWSSGKGASGASRQPGDHPKDLHRPDYRHRAPFQRKSARNAGLTCPNSPKGSIWRMGIWC